MDISKESDERFLIMVRSPVTFTRHSFFHWHFVCRNLVESTVTRCPNRQMPNIPFSDRKKIIAKLRSVRSESSNFRYIKAFSSSDNSTFTGSSILTSWRWLIIWYSLIQLDKLITLFLQKKLEMGPLGRHKMPQRAGVAFLVTHKMPKGRPFDHGIQKSKVLRFWLLLFGFFTTFFAILTACRRIDTFILKKHPKMVEGMSLSRSI